MPARMTRPLLLPVALLAAALAWPAGAREKNDVVVLVNGDHLTGEVKGLSRGKLDFLTDDAGRLSIEWVKVARVTSHHYYEIELSDGSKHFGAFLAPPAGVEGVVRLDADTSFPVPDVVVIVPLDEGLWSRIKAYLDVGFTLAKSNQAVTLTTDGEAAYRGERIGTKLSFSTYFQDDATKVAVSRGSLSLTGEYFFKRWEAVVLGGLDTNDELNLELRVSLGAGTTYAALTTNDMQLRASGGLVTTREQYSTGPATWNLDAFLNCTWEAFRYDSPKLDLSVGLTLFPGLTDWGRVRGDFVVRVKYELFNDFHVGLTFDDTFDTRPPEAGASKNDYITTFTIGWSYRR
jgi:hypothetical protein